MSHSIRRVTESDLVDLLPLMRGYCDFYHVAPTDDSLLTMSRALIADPVNEGVQFIARLDSGEAVGFATVFWSWTTTSGGRLAVMNDLFLTPAARGSGIAAELIETCRAAALEYGAVELNWLTALDNARAQGVYNKTGASRATWYEYSIALGRDA